MIILATIPVGLVGLEFEHEFRVLFGKPIRAAIFLIINGADPAGRGEVPAAGVGAGRPGASRGSGNWWRRGGTRRARAPPGTRPATRPTGRAELPARAGVGPAAGQSRLPRRQSSSAARRSWRCWRASAGTGWRWWRACSRGLSREDAARFAFLLATPVILAAGVLKVPDLMGPLGNGIHGPDPGRQHPVRRRRLRVGAVPGPLLPDPHADPVRHLLPGGRAAPACSTSA